MVSMGCGGTGCYNHVSFAAHTFGLKALHFKQLSHSNSSYLASYTFTLLEKICSCIVSCGSSPSLYYGFAVWGEMCWLRLWDSWLLLLYYILCTLILIWLWLNFIHDVVYNGLWYRNSVNVTHSWLTLAILCCLRRRDVFPVLATVASSKGRGE